MIKHSDIFSFLCKKYPLDTAADFDNVGFLVGDKGDETKGILFCLDCDINAINRADETGANLIITHHPIIFDPLKSVTADSVVYNAISKGISVISMHTNLDIAKGGVNDCLCDALGIKNVKKYETEDGFTLRCGEVDTDADTFAKTAKEALGFGVRYTGNGKIKKLLICSGSGCDYIDEAIKNGFDGIVAADSKQRHFIKAINNNFCLFDCGHYATEQVVFPSLAKTVNKKFPDLKYEIYENKMIKNI